MLAGSPKSSLFDALRWRDPLTGKALEPQVQARTPAGVPIVGALRVAGTTTGYPIVDCVARITPEAAARYAAWLEPFGLHPPQRNEGFQVEETVDSFGFQWTWNSEVRTEQDLAWRVASRFELEPQFFAQRLILDAGAGAGDQSRWLLERGASVVSVDLSAAIEVVASKLRSNERWFGVQADIGHLPFESAVFEIVYCEGVIQHTKDSQETVRELCRVAAPGAHILATHYSMPRRRLGRARHRFVTAVRDRLSRMERFRLLLVTGVLAALTSVPLVGWIVRRSGLATYSELMPDFKTTWTNTFDTYGNHTFQRHVDPDDFRAYFESVDGVSLTPTLNRVVHARIDATA